MLRPIPILTLAALCLLWSAAAGAQPFAEPIEPHPTPRDGGYEPYAAPPEPEFLPRSAVCIHTGPSLRVDERSPQGGLFAAIDVGEKAAGVRASGTWVRVGSDGGLAQYAAELWIDFGHDRRLHPILGAGAGVARLERASASGLESRSVGVGVLRGALEYVLPVSGTDARAGLEVLGAVPAIAAENAGDPKPWLLISATVGVGF